MPIQFITYHRTEEHPKSGDVYTLTFDQFSHHIDLIDLKGVSVTPPTAAFSPSPSKLLCITFDDGYRSDLINAELLAQRKLSAIFFISTANIGRDDYLDADGVRELEKLGMSVGSHSHEHIRLNTLPTDEAARQMSESKQQLESILSHPVEAIAFPGGGYSRETIRQARIAGFVHLLTTDWGVNSFAVPPHISTIKRNNILRNMSDADFVSLITHRAQFQRQLKFGIKQSARTLLSDSTYAALRRWFS